MNDKDLLDRGYHRYDPTSFRCVGLTDCFQKRFDDEKGKKYFINVNKWEGWYHPTTNEFFGPAYEYEITFTKNGAPIRMLFYANWTIEDVELEAERIWATMGYDYYEEWENEID